MKYSAILSAQLLSLFSVVPACIADLSTSTRTRTGVRPGSTKGSTITALQRAAATSSSGFVGINPISGLPDTYFIGSPSPGNTLVTVSDGTSIWLGPGPTASLSTATTTITIGGQATAVPYVPNDITFEVDDANGDITFTLGEWMHESLENATQGLSCSSNTKRSLPDLMPRDLESCSLDPYVAHIAANIELINRAVAALPEPVQNLINQYVRIDLIALGLDPRVSSPALTASGMLFVVWSSLKFSKAVPRLPYILRVPRQKPKECPTNLADWYLCEDPKCNGTPSPNMNEKCTVGSANGCSCSPLLSGNFDDWNQTYYDDAFQRLKSRKQPPSPALGTCCLHLNETESCFGRFDDLYATISLLDHNKKQVYLNTTSNSINDNAPWEIMTPFGPKMKITGEHTGDYVQFNYGNIAWASTDTADTNKDGSCTTGGWDPRGGPTCSHLVPNMVSKRQMDCCFTC